MTEEGRASLRAFRTGRKATDEQRAARSLARTGKPQSLETILKRSLALRGRKLTPEHIKKHADLLRGRPVSLEHADHLRKNALAMAKEYPALVNMRTGEAIPLGWNIKEMCRVQGLDSGNISRLINGIRKQYKGWHVAGVVK